MTKRFKPKDLNLLAANAISVADSSELLFMVATATASEAISLAGKTSIGGIILCSFSIELLLKSIHSLLASDTTFPGGHNLRALFNDISDDNLKIILTDYYGNKTGEDIQDFLLSHEIAFEEWRYFSASNSNVKFDIGNARILVEILKAEVLRLIADVNHPKQE
jgi:hypothetical protein